MSNIKGIVYTEDRLLYFVTDALEECNFDNEGNLLHYKDIHGYECWQFFDKKGKIVRSCDNEGHEFFYD
jgi:hypothetical protein